MIPIEPTLKPVRSTVCFHCPFRKDRPFWVDAIGFMWNLFRINRRIKQDCHMDMNHLCRGMETMMTGGSETIMTIEEFQSQEPVSAFVKLERYHA